MKTSTIVTVYLYIISFDVSFREIIDSVAVACSRAMCLVGESRECVSDTSMSVGGTGNHRGARNW